MKKRTRIITLLLAACIAVGAMWAKGELNRVRMVTVVQNLKDIGTAYCLYAERNKKVPADVSDLKLDQDSLIDPLDERGFQFSFAKPASTESPYVVAKQREPVCIRFWPLGERRRYAAYSDGSVMDVYE